MSAENRGSTDKRDKSMENPFERCETTCRDMIPYITIIPARSNY